MPDVDATRLAGKALVGLAQLAVAMGLALFLPAGTVRWVEGWVFLAIFVGWSLALTLYLMRRDPALLERRLKAGPGAERRAGQKVVQALAQILFLAVMILPALDHRYGWSHVPIALEVLGGVLMAAGFGIVFLVFRENSYASAVIEVGAAQEVIESGPYGVVRHPMYAGALLMLAGGSLEMGSYWGLTIVLALAVAIVWRLRDEEAVLSRELAGYDDYRRRVRRRLIPFVW